MCLSFIKGCYNSAMLEVLSDAYNLPSNNSYVGVLLFWRMFTNLNVERAFFLGIEIYTTSTDPAGYTQLNICTVVVFSQQFYRIGGSIAFLRYIYTFVFDDALTSKGTSTNPA